MLTAIWGGGGEMFDANNAFATPNRPVIDSVRLRRWQLLVQLRMTAAAERGRRKQVAMKMLAAAKAGAA